MFILKIHSRFTPVLFLVAALPFLLVPFGAFGQEKPAVQPPSQSEAPPPPSPTTEGAEGKGIDEPSPGSLRGLEAPGFGGITAEPTSTTSAPSAGGIFSRLRNVLLGVFAGVPSVDVRAKAYDAPEEEYADGPIQAMPGGWIRVKWDTRTVSDCRINYWGLLPENLGASAENNRGEPASWRGNPTTYQVSHEEGVMEIEVVCAKDTDGFPLADRVRINVEELTAGTAGGITPPPPPPQEGTLSRLRTNVRVFLGITPEAEVPLQPEETVPPIAGEVPEPEMAEPRGGIVQPESAEPVGTREPDRAEPAGGLRGLLNAIRRVPTAARDVVQDVIEIVITRPQVPSPEETVPPIAGEKITPEETVPPIAGEKPTEQSIPPIAGGKPTEQSIPPIAGVREPAQTVPPIAGIAIPSLVNNVLSLNKAQTITWKYQRGGEVQAPVLYLYLMGEGTDPLTGRMVRAYSYIGQSRADSASFNWVVPANFVKPAEPRNDIKFTYRIAIGLSANAADPQIQATSNPISVEEPTKIVPPTTITPRIVEPAPPPPPPPSTILEPELKIAPPPPPPSTILESPILSPSVDLKANGSDGPVSIVSGGSATLSWTSSNASSCTASNGWSGSKAVSGSESTGGLTASKTYTLTCSSRAGSASDSVTVNVSTLLQPRLRLYYSPPEKLQQIAAVFAQLVSLVSELGTFGR